MNVKYKKLLSALLAPVIILAGAGCAGGTQKTDTVQTSAASQSPDNEPDSDTDDDDADETDETDETDDDTEEAVQTQKVEPIPLPDIEGAFDGYSAYEDAKPTVRIASPVLLDAEAYIEKLDDAYYEFSDDAWEVYISMDDMDPELTGEISEGFDKWVEDFRQLGSFSPGEKYSALYENYLTEAEKIADKVPSLKAFVNDIFPDYFAYEEASAFSERFYEIMIDYSAGLPQGAEDNVSSELSDTADTVQGILDGFDFVTAIADGDFSALDSADAALVSLSGQAENMTSQEYYEKLRTLTDELRGHIYRVKTAVKFLHENGIGFDTMYSFDTLEEAYDELREAVFDNV